MVTKAQTTTNHPKPQKPYQPTRLLHKTRHPQERQPNDCASALNKPNFKNTKINTNYSTKRLYEDFRLRVDMKNKPKQSQFRALQEKMWLLRCSENRQGKDGEAGNIPHCRCSSDAELAICSNRQQLQICLNCSTANKKTILKTSTRAFCLEQAQLNSIFVPMKKPILYLGDTSLKEAGSYLAGVMTYYHLNFDYLPSDENFNNSLLDNDYNLIILSDYPANNFTEEQLKILAEKIQQGTGLLMIGGWESFTGPNCEYNDTILSEILPITMKSSDDRINCPQPCLIKKNAEHKIIKSLPFDENPPCIGGYNQFKAKPKSQTILSACRFDVCYEKDSFKFHPLENTDPLLVLGSFGKANVCALATDAAPHWVGGLVDWGNDRIKAQAPGANQIEVGNWYAEFIVNIIKWTMADS